jgi:hypothetical protein
MFYRTDFWSLWDVAIIIVAIAFSITSEPRCTERAFAALLTCCQGLSVSSSKIRT